MRTITQGLGNLCNRLSGADKVSKKFGLAMRVTLAFFLPSGSQVHVFRAAVLSIVLALAAAPEAMLLCRLWCPNEVSVGDCHHHGQSSSARVKAADVCGADASVIALTREDSRRAAAGSGTGHAVVVQHDDFAGLTRPIRTAESWARVHALEKRPLETTLRL
jgi:hypothetical protein